MRSRDWEATFRAWSKPPSETEQAKCENAERMIRDAVGASSVLGGRSIKVFAQGSYKNSTNVRHDSDVDICVLRIDVLFSDFSMAEGFTRKDAGIVDVDYPYSQYKNEVEEALVARFGRRAVVRGNKAFDVHENTYRVEADVVACFEHRRYTKRGSDGRCYYLSGVELRPDNGGRIINWPQQHYDNGVGKNGATGNRFKYITRVLKRLRNEMEEAGIAAAKPVPSYLIECLVWNAPNAGFGHDQYTADVRHVLAHTFNETITDEGCSEWGEVNELKYLFRPSKPWTRTQAHAFLSAAWDYVGFE